MLLASCRTSHSPSLNHHRKSKWNLIMSQDLRFFMKILLCVPQYVHIYVEFDLYVFIMIFHVLFFCKLGITKRWIERLLFIMNCCKHHKCQLWRAFFFHAQMNPQIPFLEGCSFTILIGNTLFFHELQINAY